jgi:hypothetical protein
VLLGKSLMGFVTFIELNYCDNVIVQSQVKEGL